jgi:hypothetical protein
MSDLRPIKVTKWLSSGGTNVLSHSAPVWVVVKHTGSRYYRVTHTFEHHYQRLAYVDKKDGDEWVDPSPEEWPDEVCVFMAKHALTGDA